MKNARKEKFNFGSLTLSALAFLFLLDLVQSFSTYIDLPHVTLEAIKNNTAVCPPYFTKCLNLYFFDTLPTSYSQNIFYAILGTFIFAAFVFLYKKDYFKFVIFSSIPLLYKIFLIYFLTYLIPGNYNSFGVFLGIILLFSAYKVFYLRILVCLFYLCSAVIKLHQGYLSGEVFSSLNLGAPLIPSYFLEYVGVLFFLMCALAPFFLLNGNKRVRVFFLLVLTVFHLYSIIMVGFRYPLLLLPIIWILFYFEDQKVELKRLYLKDFVGMLTLGLMVLLQLLPLAIRGDERMTGEGYRYGYYMYDGNHQCSSHKKIYLESGEIRDMFFENTKALYSCDPYEEWFKIQRLCGSPLVSNVSWTYDHSLNGGQYRRIVDSFNACILDYSPFIHNEWINENGPIQDREVLKNSI